MVRLTRAKKEQHLGWLYQWRSPADMLQHVHAAMDELGNVDLFNQAGLEFLRDSWAAATFGNIRDASAVRLVEAEWPDFELKFGDAVEAFEVTEADVPGRRRGQEYKEAAKQPGLKDDPYEDWVARADKVPEALKMAAEKKAKKGYSGKAQLLIYLNIGEYGIRREEIEGCMQASTEAAKDNFDAVWVLWKACAYKVWDQGNLTNKRFMETPKAEFSFRI